MSLEVGNPVSASTMIQDVPLEFRKECLVHYNRPLTWMRVTHEPTGINHYQDDSGCKMRESQAKEFGLKVVYNIFLGERMNSAK